MRAGFWYGALALALLATPVQAQTAVTAGKLVVDAPTLTAIGVEWKITGDDNRNAVVEVSYRKKGETAWRKALPLLRNISANGTRLRIEDCDGSAAQRWTRR